MKNILWIFARRSTLFLLGVYMVLSFLLMNLNDPYTLRSLRIVVLKTVSWVNTVKNKLNYLENLKEENKGLRKQNVELALQNEQLHEAMLENIRLRRLLRFKERSSYQLIAANVIGSGQEQTVQSLILNVGSREGVQKNMPVVTDRGLVGKIIAANPHQSLAQILLDRNSLVSVRLQKSREVGVIGWSGNFWLDLNYIPRDVPVELGEVVVTSGLSRIYPAGIKVGIVAQVIENQYELFKEIRVKPAVNFNRLEEVFIIAATDSVGTERAGSD